MPSQVTIRALTAALEVIGDNGKKIVLNRISSRLGIPSDKPSLETVIDLQVLEIELTRIFGTGSRIITRLIDAQPKPAYSR